MSTLWQIASGPLGRNYKKVFLNYDVMLIGPGTFGDYYQYQNTYKNKKFFDVKRFVEQVNEDDVVLLRNGKNVIDIGLVPKDGYEWNDTFGDVYGWNLQHTRRVIWQNHRDELNRIQEKKEDEVFYRERMRIFSRVDRNKLLKIQSLLDKVQLRHLKTFTSTNSTTT